MKEFIQNLAEKDLKFFPCYKSNKSPKTTNGFYDATNKLEKLKSLFLNYEDYLIGFPTGQMNFNIVVIDVDINKLIPGTDIIDTRTSDELLDALEEKFDSIPRDGFQVQTKNGGLHFYFKAPQNIKIVGGTRFFDDSLAIDFIAHGKYVIFPDNENYIVYDSDIEIDDFYNHIPDLPEWIIDFKKQNEEVEEQTNDNVLPPEEILEIRSALSFLDADDRDSWINVGLALKSTGSSSAYGLWDNWSQTSNKYNPNDMIKRWKGLKPNDITIASLFFEAKKNGWVTTYKKEESVIQVCDIPEELNIIIPNFEKKPFPKELLKPEGLIGELIDYTNFRSFKEQPIYALAGSLAAFGTLLGRKIKTETGTKTNIYTLGVGTSGSGKEAFRSTIKKIFGEMGANELVGVEDIASDSAIMTAMAKQPSQLFLLDEIGRFIQTTSGGAKNTHLYNVISLLLKLYSGADDKFSGKIFADADKQVVIDRPNLCLYGSTVPETLYKGLTTQALTDGFLSRMLIFESDLHNPRAKRRKEMRGMDKIPKDLLDGMAKIHMKGINYNVEGNLDHHNVNAQVVEYSDGAMDMVEDFTDEIHEIREKLIKEKRHDGVFNRTVQMADQVALILAGINNPDNPIITEKEMEYAIKLVDYLGHNMLYIAENHIADNDHEHAVKWVLDIIRKFKTISLTQLTKKTQKLKSYERNDIIETLKNSADIIEIEDGTGVKKTRYFRAL